LIRTNTRSLTAPSPVTAAEAMASLAPGTRLLSYTERLLVLPTGRLFHLPFELLPWRDGLLNDAVTAIQTVTLPVT
jgi:hypothetical protein